MSNDPHAGGAVLHAGSPLPEAALAVVLLHGRGGSARDILGLGSALNLPQIAYLAPEAAGHAWYPLSFLAPRESNEPYLGSALRKVETILESLAQAGFASQRVVIAGFSQGACLTTEFVATHPARYAAMMAFTGGLIGAPGTLGQPAGELAGTPALLLSGDPDPHVPWSRVEESAAILESMGAQVKTRRFPGRPHTVSREELELARELLLQIRDGHPS